LCARLDVRLVHAKNGFRFGAIQLIETALRANRFMQQRTHRAIGNENRVLQPFIKFLNLQLAFQCFEF
jgi:hypothetical protein